MARKSGAHARFGSNPAVQAKRPATRRRGTTATLRPSGVSQAIQALQCPAAIALAARPPPPRHPLANDPDADRWGASRKSAAIAAQASSSAEKVNAAFHTVLTVHGA